MSAPAEISRKGQFKVVDPAVLPPEAREREPQPAAPPPEMPARAPTPSAADTPAPKRGRKRLLFGAAAMLALAAGAWQGYDYWTTGRFMVTTDDAYVGAESAAISARLNAYVAEVAVAANQRVKSGDVLVRLDAADYRSALDQARARLETQRASVARIATQAEAAEASILQARAQAEGAEAELTRAQSALERTQQLAQSSYTSRAALETAQADRDRARAQRAAAEAAIASARAARSLAEAQRVEAERAAAEIEVSIAKAERDVVSTTLSAPFDGVVAARAVQVGDYAAPGKRLMSLVPIDRVHVDANFKETQVARIVPGETVRIHVDAYPGRDFEGEVIGLAPGTGSTFSLLPADNATGNFTKIVQRVPVRIAVRQPGDGALLRPGMSVTASIDVRTAPGR